MSNVPRPGFAAQEKYRNAFRLGGVLVFGVGLLLTGIALADFFSGFGDMDAGFPTKFPLAFIGLPLVGVGGWLLQAGFLGAASRYVAGETIPVVKDSAAYLTDGEGLLGMGRTADDQPSKFCSQCGKPAGEDARFCESCGHAFA
jgi:hypothetical protein